MTLRGFMYFLIAFTTVIVLGLLSGCSSDEYHASKIAKGYSYAHYCGMSRCDGKENR